MMNKKGVLFVLLALFVCGNAFAQGRKGLCINEVLVQNDSNYVDDYGVCNAWVELYNSTYATMEIATVYITNDKNNPTKYPIPRGDVNTKIPPRQHTLFWADNEPERGTFHMNFKLNPNQENWIGVYDSNGITLIDSITIPALGSNQSYARKSDGIFAEEGLTANSAWGVRYGTKKDGDYVTPSSNNIIIDTNIKKQAFVKNDPYGIIMSLMAMGVVFSALLILSLSFRFIGKFSEKLATKNKMKAHGVDEESLDVHPATVKGGDSGEEIAAICMALYEHLNAHDNEDTILTINKVKKAYSPWSSKIYTLRETPRR